MNKLQELASEAQSSDLGAYVRAEILMPCCVLGILVGTVGNATLTGSCFIPLPFPGGRYLVREGSVGLYLILQGESPWPGLARCSRGQDCSPPHSVLGQPCPQGCEGDRFGTMEVGT